MQNRMVAVVAVVMLIVGASATYGWYAVVQRPAPVSRQQGQTGPMFMEVAGSLYYALDVTNDLGVPSEGYAYFENSSISFLGVQFETVCPTTLIGCPGSSNSTGETSAGLPGVFVKAVVIFPDGKREILTESIEALVYAPVVSNHVGPKAGILVEYIPATKEYRAFLLVTPYTVPGGA